jgi:hypothetical protein
MHFDNHRQSESRATLGLGTRAVHLMELVEDALTLLKGDAGAGITDAHNEPAILCTRRDAYLARVRKFDGVSDQIEQNLGEAWLVAEGILLSPSLSVQSISSRESSNNDLHRR